jgi:asparagine synthase (glutamine-hydrolysing)
MFSRSGRYVLVFNGEIYNHLELRETLERDAPNGMTWKGHSDTETILQLFDTYGIESTIPRLDGMFGICCYDSEDESIFLARDRLGEKPLFFGSLGSDFVASSTVHFAAQLNDAERPNLNDTAVCSLLTNNFIPAESCIYENFQKVHPGTIVRYCLNSECISSTRYFKLQHSVSRQSSETDQIRHLDEILSNAVNATLISDRPVGCFLSGGIDSSLITALAVEKLGKNKVKTFTIGYDDEEYSEAPFAESIARHLGSDHKTLTVTPDHVIEAVKQMSKVYDEPFADYSQVPTYLLSKLTSEHVTVALSGDGGDELFGGYNRYLYYQKVRTFSRLPAGLRKCIGLGLRSVNTSTLDRVAGPLTNINSVGIKLLKLSEAMMTSNPFDYYRAALNHGIDNASLAAVNCHTSTSADLKDFYDSIGEEATDEEKLMLLDLYTYLPDDILVKVDRASMASSLECRAPFLNQSVISAALQTPLEYKIRGGESKWILKKILDKYVPREAFERPKMGFGFPLDRWLREDLKEWAEDLLFGDVGPEFNYTTLDMRHRFWREHLSGINRFAEIWAIVMLHAWLKDNR